MSDIMRSIRKRIWWKNEESPHVSPPEVQKITKDPVQSYTDWINKRLRRECFFDDNTLISHWVPYLLLQPSVSREEQLKHSWSPSHKSDHIEIKEDDPFIIHRNPISLSTDAARGKQGYSSGVHIWKIVWPENQRGTHAVIGVATDKCLLQYSAYVPLIGLDTESWGWDIVNMVAVHDSGESNPIEFRSYPDNAHKKTENSKTKVPETVYVILDMDNGSLSFVASNRFLGVAHFDLKGKTLYPAVSSVWGHSEISLHYFNNISYKPPSLRCLSLFVAKKLLKYHCLYNQLQYHTWFSKQVKCFNKGSSHRYIVQKLQIPSSLKGWLISSTNTAMT